MQSSLCVQFIPIIGADEFRGRGLSPPYPGACLSPWDRSAQSAVTEGRQPFSIHGVCVCPLACGYQARQVLS